MNSRISLFQQAIAEFIRYDFNSIKFIFTPLLYLYLLSIKKNPVKCIDTLASIFRLNWPGTFKLSLFFVKKNILNNNRQIKSEIYHKLLSEIRATNETQKFFDDPSTFLNGIITVVSPKTETNKGVIVIAYSFYFLLFLKRFNVSEIANNYHIVLEPSWNGVCEKSILAFTALKTPVFVMAYEDRDYNFIKQLKSNLVAIKLSANWWIDHNKFISNTDIHERPIDIICISTWAKFKRHIFIFQALRKLKNQGHIYNLTLIGYPADMSIDDLKKIAEDFGVLEQISFHEWITPQQVNELLNQAKVNIVWSRFEGLNRAIIEGMFCNTPCILREGFNFGEKYQYINTQTGIFSTESQLANNISQMIQHPEKFSPRDYVIKHHNYHKATEILSLAIQKIDNNHDASLMVPKVSELNGMKYLSDSDEKKFIPDYHYLREMIIW